MKVLLSHSLHFFSSEELNNFNTKLSFGKKYVTDNNIIQLHKLKTPATSINVRHKIHSASKIDSDKYYSCLSSLLHICEGAHIIFTRNLWVEKGLCNSSMGLDRGIIYQNGKLNLEIIMAQYLPVLYKVCANSTHV